MGTCFRGEALFASRYNAKGIKTLVLSCDKGRTTGQTLDSTSWMKNVMTVIMKHSVVAVAGFSLLSPWAVIADGTDAPSSVLNPQEYVANMQASRPLNSDEFIISFDSDSLGLKLVENLYKGFPVVTVQAIKSTNLAINHPELEIGAIVSKINGEIVDGKGLAYIAEKVKSSSRPVQIMFRDPSRFFKLLDSTAGPPKRVITTSYLPANTRDVGAPEQIIRVERLVMPPPEQRVRAAELLDVMEIQYTAQIQGSEIVVDSSALKSSPGSSFKSIYYVLGQRNGPPGKVPPGWDLTLRGMVVGEVRQITLPYSLAFDRRGDKANGIPPFADIVYTVKLLSLT
eukprot:gene29939-36157_t